MLRYKWLTHVCAVAVGALWGFSQTNAGHALVVQYPMLTSVVVVLAMLAGLYHIPLKRTAMILLLCFFALNASAQEKPVSLFSFSTQAVVLRFNSVSAPGTDVLGVVPLTQNLFLEDHNVLAPGMDFQGYMAGPRYRLPFEKIVSKTQLPKNTFDAYVHGAFGIVRNVPATGPASQHYGGFFGLGVDYDPTHTGKFTVNLIRVDRVNAPGFGPHPWGWSVSVGIQLGIR